MAPFVLIKAVLSAWRLTVVCRAGARGSLRSPGESGRSAPGTISLRGARRGRWLPGLTALHPDRRAPASGLASEILSARVGGPHGATAEGEGSRRKGSPHLTRSCWEPAVLPGTSRAQPPRAPRGHSSRLFSDGTRSVVLSFTASWMWVEHQKPLFIVPWI